MSQHKYYIFCPANTKTGGPEALHQLAYYMRNVGLEAFIVYYGQGFPESNTIAEYLQYNPQVIRYQDIEDSTDNFVIAPENAPWCLNRFRKAQKCIWWLSLHANEVKKGSTRDLIRYYKRIILHRSTDNYRFITFNPNKCWHLCASKHTFQYVSTLYYRSRVDYLVEPISLDFLKMGNSCLPTNREDIVLYNPAKPSSIMTELLKRGRYIYIPLKGFSPIELAEKYKQAKLYVDFGHFGGPERMPKEAVYFGCNILVANHNAAANDFDVAIPTKYKVDDSETAEDVELRIDEMLDNYDLHYHDFDGFRTKIQDLEYNFTEQISTLFL